MIICDSQQPKDNT